MNILAVMAYQMLRQNIKIIIGFNQIAKVQINSIPENCSTKKFQKIMEVLQYYINFCNDESPLSTSTTLKKTKVDMQILDDAIINEYLISKKAEKVVVFSDLDPENEICELSKKCKVYWFCFKKTYLKGTLDAFKGNFFRITETKDILSHLRNMDNIQYEKQQRKSGEIDNRDFDDWDYSRI